MRELKFKAWIDEFTNYDDVIVPAHMSDTFTFSDFDGDYYIPEDCYLSDMHIMQFTGLKDKNGKEIYEGDIVEQFLSDSEDENILYFGSIEYLAPEFCVRVKDKSYCVILRNTGHNIKVIGNVFENPHLLTN